MSILILAVIVKKEGFIYLYVTNENDQDMEVYFDDFVVNHIYDDIVAEIIIRLGFR